MVDWVTPFSLLYLYKNIGGRKMAAEKTEEADYAKIRDDTVGVERIKLLLERDETTV